MVPVHSRRRASRLLVIGGVYGRIAFRTILDIVTPALVSLAISLIIESPLAIFLSLWSARSFARYLSKSDDVGDVTAYMWRTLDWCYYSTPRRPNSPGFFSPHGQSGIFIRASQAIYSTSSHGRPFARLETLMSITHGNITGLSFEGGALFAFIYVHRDACVTNSGLTGDSVFSLDEAGSCCCGNSTGCAKLSPWALHRLLRGLL